MLWLIGAYWVAWAIAMEPSERTFNASAALIGAATFALTSDIASRSGSAAADSLSTSLLASWRLSNSPRPSSSPQLVQVLVTSILECWCSLPMTASFAPDVIFQGASGSGCIIRARTNTRVQREDDDARPTDKRCRIRSRCNDAAADPTRGSTDDDFARPFCDDLVAPPRELIPPCGRQIEPR